MTFKVGDRVRVKESGAKNIRGREGVVAEVNETDNCLIDFGKGFDGHSGGAIFVRLKTATGLYIVPQDLELLSDSQTLEADMNEKNIAKKLAKLLEGGMTAKDVTVQRTKGHKTIEIGDLPIDEAITWLKRKKEDEEKEVALNYELEGFPLDVAVNFYDALMEEFGFVQKVDIPGFWSDTPPVMIAVPVSATEVREVPWGRIVIPGVSGYVQHAIKTDPEGRVVGDRLLIVGKVKQKHMPKIAEVIKLTKQRMKTHSIYKGKAIELDLSWQRSGKFDPVSNAPKFTIPLDGALKDRLIFSKQVAEDIQVGLFTALEQPDVCNDSGVPVKRGVLLAGEFGCLAGESEVYDPVLDTYRRVDEIDDAFHVLAWNGREEVVTKAEKPFLKGRAKLYRVTLGNGESFVATHHHRVLTQHGWTAVDRLSPLPAGCDPAHLESTGDTSLLVCRQGGQHLSRKQRDSLARYYQDHRPHDAQPQSESDTDRVSALLSADVLGRSLPSSRVGGRGDTQGNSLPCHDSDHQSTFRSGGHSDLHEDAVEYGSEGTPCGSAGSQFQTGSEGLSGSILTRTISASLELETASQSCVAALGDSVNCVRFTHVISVELVREDSYYDFTVPDYGNYVLGGVVHHNTGKTMTAWVAAKMAVDNGMGFIYLKSALDLAACFEFARMYQEPGGVVVFCEDVNKAIVKDDADSINVLQNAFDGVNTKTDKIVTVLTTNFLDQVPQSLLRPGRIDLLVKVERPDAEAAVRLVQQYGGDLLSPDMDFKVVGKAVANHLPAEIREVVERSKMACISRLCKGQGRIDKGGFSIKGQVMDSDIVQAAHQMKVQHEMLKPKEEDTRSERVKAAQITAEATMESAKLLAGPQREPEYDFLSDDEN